MNFPEREEKIKQVQNYLDLKDDGDAGILTWKAIANKLKLNAQNLEVKEIIPLVQKKLNLLVDGKDGKNTWNAILNIFEIKEDEPVNSTGKYSERIKLSPQTNGQYSQKIIPKAIVMHDTGGNYEGSIDWTSKIINPSTGKRLYASYHCIIARDGRRTITNLDTNRAYHAGASSFKGKSGLNSWSLGVSFERDSHSEPLQDAAIESAIEYIIPRMKKWGITPEWVTDHRTVSPNRKVDLKKQEFEKFHKKLKEKWESYQK